MVTRNVRLSSIAFVCGCLLVFQGAQNTMAQSKDYGPGSGDFIPDKAFQKTADQAFGKLQLYLGTIEFATPQTIRQLEKAREWRLRESAPADAMRPENLSR